MVYEGRRFASVSAEEAINTQIIRYMAQFRRASVCEDFATRRGWLRKRPLTKIGVEDLRRRAQELYQEMVDKGTLK